MGLAGGSREMIKFIGGRFEWIGIWSKSVKIQSPFGLCGLERIGFERCKIVVAQAIWLEQAGLQGQSD